MDRRFLQVLVQVTLVVLLAQSGSAVKCYVCNSGSDPKCGDPADVSGLTLTECTSDLLQSATSAISNIFKSIYPQGASNVDLKMACQKIDVTESSGDKMTLRSCSFADSDTFDSCGAFEATNKMSTEKKMSFCGLCTHDGCNSSNSLRAGAFLLSLVIAGFAVFTA